MAIFFCPLPPTSGSPDAPLAASFDLHGNLPPAIVAHLDFATGYRTYPHVDMRETAARAVTQGSEAVQLSTREFDLLHALMLNAGRVMSRDQIEQRMYSWGEEVESNAVEVHVHHLRRKLGTTMVVTVRGVGYMLGHSPKPP